MKKMIALTKVYLKETIGGIGSQSGKGKLAKALVFLIPVLLLPQVFLISHMFYRSMVGTPLQHIPYVIAVLTITFMNFMTVCLGVVSALGGDKNTSALLSMPIRTSMIFEARLLMLYLFSVLEAVYLLIPMTIFYSMDFGVGVIFPSLIVALVIPIIPMAVSLLLLLPLMRFFANSRFKKYVTYLFNALFLVAYILFLGSVQSENTTAIDLASYINSQFMYIYPPAMLAAEFVLGNLARGLILVGSCVAITAVVLLLSRLFVSKIIKSSDTFSVKKGKVEANSASPMKRLLQRQTGILFASSRFVLQGLGSMFMLPILLTIYHFSGLLDVSKLANVILLNPDLAFFVILGLMVSTTFASSLAVSSIAREGATFWENKVLPISGKTQVVSRLTFSLLFELPVPIVLSVVSIVVFKMDLLMALLGGIAGLGLVLGFTCMDHFIDILYPNIRWTNEMQAVKNSQPVIIASFAKMIAIGALAGLVYVLSWKLHIPLTYLKLAILVLGVVFGAVGLGLLMTNGVTRYNEIEV